MSLFGIVPLTLCSAAFMIGKSKHFITFERHGANCFNIKCKILYLTRKKKDKTLKNNKTFIKKKLTKLLYYLIKIINNWYKKTFLKYTNTYIY